MGKIVQNAIHRKMLEDAIASIQEGKDVFVNTSIEDELIKELKDRNLYHLYEPYERIVL